MLPKRISRPRMNLREEVREFPGHRAWVRLHGCSVPGCDRLPIVFAHVRKGLPADEAGGIALKPHDKWGCSLCNDHHSEQHILGETTFSFKHGIDLVAIAREFARLSPHRWRWEP